MNKETRHTNAATNGVATHPRAMPPSILKSSWRNPLTKAMPITAAIATLAAASMAGLPPLGGFISKELMLYQTPKLALFGVPWLLPVLATTEAPAAPLPPESVEIPLGAEPSAQLDSESQQRIHDLLVFEQTVEQLPAVVPGFHRVRLNDPVGVFAAHAGLC